MNPKLLKRMARKPRVTGKVMVYYPQPLHAREEIPTGSKVRTASLCGMDGTIMVTHLGVEYRVFLNDLCER